MSAFPTLPWTRKSRERWLDDRQVRRATNNAARGISRSSAKKKAFELDFELLGDADKAALETHYDAHRTASFDFTWRDGLTYTVIYGEKNGELGIETVIRWSGRVVLEQA